jgi:hypothetical protein
MASPREQADALSAARARRAREIHLAPVLTSTPAVQHYRHHHFHDVPPWPHRRYGDYVVVEGWGWWPRWFPYWDQRWYSYWWHLYDYYGGDAYPEYAEYARDAYLRQHAPQWGLAVSGWVGVELAAPSRDHRAVSAPVVYDHRGIVPTHGAPPIVAPPYRDHRGIVPTHGAPPVAAPPHDDRHERPRYRHPHDYYGDYFVVEGVWWPRWFPYWETAWIRYWWQLYYYYGGDTHADYAQYARDAYLRALAAQWGWIR